METSLPTCKSRLRLCREKLRHKLQARGFADEISGELPADASPSGPSASRLTG